MLIRPPADISSSEITPKAAYLRRREFLGALVAASGLGDALTTAHRVVTTTDALTPRQAVTTYCNFYEFGSAKSDAVQFSGAFKPRPWFVVVEGLCGKPGTYTLEDILKPHVLEERLY